MIENAKDAVKIAREYVIDIIGSEMTIGNVYPEEIDFDEVNNQWMITIGYEVGSFAGAIGFMTAGPNSPNRTYKIVYIDRNTGQVKKMKIRVVE